MLNKLQKLKH